MIEFSSFHDVSEKEWNSAVKSLDGNYFYCYEYLQYFNYLNLKSLRNRSFLIKENKKILSITPYIIFEDTLGLEASFAGSPLSFSLYDKSENPEKTEEILNLIFKKINNISKELKIKKLLIRSPHLSNLDNSDYFDKIMNKNNFELIQNSDFLSLKSSSELILDLNDDISLRKKHTSYVNYTNDKTITKEITKDHFNENLFRMYTEFHNANKKNQRTKNNFEYNKSLILNGMQSIFLCLYGDEIINAVVIVNYNCKAHYNSSINKIVDKKIYGNFVLLNKAINFYKLKKFTSFFLGDVIDQNSLKYNQFSDKELSLSRFKNNWKGNLYSFKNYSKFF